MPDVKQGFRYRMKNIVLIVDIEIALQGTLQLRHC